MGSTGLEKEGNGYEQNQHARNVIDPRHQEAFGCVRVASPSHCGYRLPNSTKHNTVNYNAFESPSTPGDLTSAATA